MCVITHPDTPSQNCIHSNFRIRLLKLFLKGNDSKKWLDRCSDKNFHLPATNILVDHKILKVAVL